MRQRVEIDMIGNVVSSKGLKNVGTAKDPNYVVNFRFASNHFAGEEASFFNVAAWDRNAINLASNLRPGKPLRIVGTLELKQFPSNKHFLTTGQPALLTSADVRMERFEYIDSPRPADTGEQAAAGAGEQAAVVGEPAEGAQTPVQAEAGPEAGAQVSAEQAATGTTRKTASRRRSTSKTKKSREQVPAGVLGETGVNDLTQTQQDEF
jgi:single-stranded DNA-binding protein